MNVAQNNHLSFTARQSVSRVETRINRLKKQRELLRKRELINNLFFLGFGAIFAVSVIYLMVQNGGLTGSTADFSGAFEKLLNR